MKKIVRYLAIVVLLFVVNGEASAQWMKERGWVRKGNKEYEKKNYEGSIEKYTEALEIDPTSFEAQYDLASALYRAERYGEAEGILSSIVKDERRSEIERGEVAYNLGNTQFAQQKYQEALASYRLAMRYNANDEDAKFNYTYVKRLLQQQQQQQQQNKDKQDNKDKEQQQDQQQQNQQNQQDQNSEGQNDKENKQNNENKENQQDKPEDQDKQDNQGDKNQDQPQSQNGQQPQPQNGDEKQQQGGENSQNSMNQAQHEAVLQAIQAEEDKTQDKLKEKGAVMVYGGKNW